MVDTTFLARPAKPTRTSDTRIPLNNSFNPHLHRTSTTDHIHTLILGKQSPGLTMSATVITHAKFVVYQDKTSLAQPGVVPRDNRAANANPRPIAVATAGDKENLHPITGLPSRMLTSLSKKRKTAVLTTKLLVVSEAPCSPKKRRVSTLPKNPSNLSGKSGLSQRPRRANKAATSRSARRVPKLPRVQEEDVEETERASERVIGELSAKAVDARCYELTVVPLADISEAYEVISDQESVKDGEAPVRI